METDSQQPENQQIAHRNTSGLTFSRLASIGVIIIGCFALIGWIFNIETFKSVLPGLVSMKANTAINFILGGVSLCNFRTRNKEIRVYPSAFAMLLILIALLTLIEYIFNLNLGIDQLLFKDSANAIATAHPGRMAPNTALTFILIGSALLLLNRSRPKYTLAQLFSIVGFLIAFLGFLGYLYGNAYFYQLDRAWTGMALHTSIAFVLLCAGILFASPDRGMMATISSHNAGGIMAQRLYPAAIAIPPLLCWLILLGYRSQVYTAEMAISLLGISNVSIFSVLIWWNARSLGAIDNQRRQAERSLQEAFAELEMKVEEQKRIATELGVTVHQVTAAVNELGASSETTAKLALAADRETQRAQALSSEGTAAVERTIEGMAALQEKVEAIARESLRCQNLIGQIGGIARAVSDLANQTNMLALNAAIESVRAGEGGKGFGVVATEIRKLADQSKESADLINRHASDIEKAIFLTVKVADEGQKRVLSGAKVTQETVATFQGVAEAIGEIASFNQQIALAAKEQAVALGQVVNAMNCLNAEANYKVSP